MPIYPATHVGAETHRHAVGTCQTTFTLPGRRAPGHCGDPRCGPPPPLAAVPDVCPECGDWFPDADGCDGCAITAARLAARRGRYAACLVGGNHRADAHRACSACGEDGGIYPLERIR